MNTNISRISELQKRFENGGAFPTAEEYKEAMGEDIRNPVELRVEWSNEWPEELRGPVLMD